MGVSHGVERSFCLLRSESITSNTKNDMASHINVMSTTLTKIIWYISNLKNQIYITSEPRVKTTTSEISAIFILYFIKHTHIGSPYGSCYGVK